VPLQPADALRLIVAMRRLLVFGSSRGNHAPRRFEGLTPPLRRARA
jgi:hypothetical protein